MSSEPVIAQKPASPRDSSKLLVYNTQTDQIIIDRFYHLDQYLPKNSFLVLNKTKVIPSRIWLSKKTGGKLRVLFLLNEKTEKENLINILVDRRVNVGDKLFFNEKDYVEVINQEEKYFTVKILFSKDKLLTLLNKNGQMPIPPYIKNTPLKESDLRKKYQTIFAEENGSIAAPTASLHFTKRVFNKLEQKGINRLYLTLHVGLGTFAPVTENNLKMKTLHKEYYEISKKTLQCINKLKQNKTKLVAIGTTVVRALESIKNLEFRVQNFKLNSEPRILNSKTNSEFSILNSKFRSTNLFILPPYDFKIVDCLITNFHLPGSSLLLLVDAFLQFKKAKRSLSEIYEFAMKENFRFYSFGDVMLIL